MSERQQTDTVNGEQPNHEVLEYFKLTLIGPRPTPFEVTIKGKETRWSRFMRLLTGRR
jgi:hypothetical protein